MYVAISPFVGDICRFSAKTEDITYTYNPCYPFTTGPDCTDVAVSHITS